MEVVHMESLAGLVQEGKLAGHQVTGGALEFDRYFAGKAKLLPKFRIPGADNKADIFFNNHQLLTRWASMPLPSQAFFLKSVRSVMDNKDTNIVHIIVQWTEKKTRTLEVKGYPGISGDGPGKYNGHMDFELLP